MKDKVYIIAEAGVNHNGSPDLAKDLVEAAVKSGADAVKFQTFKATSLVSRIAPKADYQIQNTGNSDSQLQMLKKLELSLEDQKTLAQLCSEKKIDFLSSPFDVESVDVVSNQLEAKILKIPSGEITNGPLVIEVARQRKPIILSTGMSSLEEIEQALSVIAFGIKCSDEEPSVEKFNEAYSDEKQQNWLKENVTLLHCTTEYPAPLSEVNLRAMTTMREHFGLKVGYSDHTQGINIPVAAVALGATVIEKHFTLDTNMSGPDHKASLNPVDLKSMVEAIKQVELGLGDGKKVPTSSEKKNIPIARRSLVAKKIIKKGETFSKDNVTFKRPGGGVSPMKYWEYLGNVATKDYEEDQIIEG